MNILPPTHFSFLSTMIPFGYFFIDGSSILSSITISHQINISESTDAVGKLVTIQLEERIGADTEFVLLI